jgi:ectoine hydroxylase-related dioxygenase (phytanoyl-CoA dioxygenase family)
VTALDVVHAAAEAERHPWNTSFSWPDHGRVGSRLTADQIAQYDELGYVIVKDAFDLDRLAAVRDAIEPYERKVNDFLRRLDGGRFEVAAADALTVTLHLSTLSPACRDLVFDPVMADLCRELIGPDVRLYWDQAVYKLPHNHDVVPWHQDNGYVYVEPQDYLTCWVPLVDATLDNGTVWVVPGAHRRGTLRHWPTDLGWRCLPESTDGAVAVEAPAGSIVVFSSLTPHRTGPNITDDVRSAYILQYAPDGAQLLQGDPAEGPGTAVPCTEAGRQLPLLVGGQLIPPPPLA